MCGERCSTILGHCFHKGPHTSSENDPRCPLLDSSLLSFFARQQPLLLSVENLCFRHCFPFKEFSISMYPSVSQPSTDVSIRTLAQHLWQHTLQTSTHGSTHVSDMHPQIRPAPPHILRYSIFWPKQPKKKKRFPFTSLKVHNILFKRSPTVERLQCPRQSTWLRLWSPKLEFLLHHFLLVWPQRGEKKENKNKRRNYHSLYRHLWWHGF